MQPTLLESLAYFPEELFIGEEFFYELLHTLGYYGAKELPEFLIKLTLNVGIYSHADCGANLRPFPERPAQPPLFVSR